MAEKLWRTHKGKNLTNIVTRLENPASAEFLRTCTHKLEDGKENRYTRLMNRIIKPGVKTKVLMLSATPVNNRFYDLRNQLALAYEGSPAEFNEKLKTKSDIDTIFRQAQTVYNSWCKLPEEERTKENLLKQLDFDFFEVLDSVTIARSRKHIQNKLP